MLSKHFRVLVGLPMLQAANSNGVSLAFGIPATWQHDLSFHLHQL